MSKLIRINHSKVQKIKLKVSLLKETMHKTNKNMFISVIWTNNNSELSPKEKDLKLSRQILFQETNLNSKCWTIYLRLFKKETLNYLILAKFWISNNNKVLIEIKAKRLPLLNRETFRVLKRLKMINSTLWILKLIKNWNKIIFLIWK